MAQNDYCVIGLGRFGLEVANYLAGEGKKVLVIDNNKQIIERLQQNFDYAIVADATNSKVLEEIGIWKVNAVIVCVSNVETSTTICANLKDLKVKNIMARAKNYLHKRILTILGINNTIIPEVIVGRQFGFRAIHDTDVDMVNINQRVLLLNIAMNNEFLTNRPLDSLNLRNGGINIITINRNGNIIFPITSQTSLQLGDNISIVCDANESNKVVKIFSNNNLK